MTTPTKFRRRFKSGFSLVEVVISIGIVSIALLPIFSLLPMGLATFHSSSELYFSSQARQHILDSLQQTDISNLLKVQNPYQETDYFDDQGTFVGSKVAGGQGITLTGDPVYQVLVTVSDLNSNQLPLTLPNKITQDLKVNTVGNAVLVSTQFSRYNSTAAANTTTGGSSYQIGTDYLYYKNPTIN